MLASTLREATMLLMPFCWILNTEGRIRERDIGIPPGVKTQAVVAANGGINEPTETLTVYWVDARVRATASRGTHQIHCKGRFGLRGVVVRLVPWMESRMMRN